MSDANAGARPKPGLIFEKSKPGRRAGRVPSYALPVPELPAELKRESPPRLPEVPENEIVRHFTDGAKSIRRLVVQSDLTIGCLSNAALRD